MTADLKAAREHVEAIIKEHHRIADWHANEGRPESALNRRKQAEPFETLLTALDQAAEALIKARIAIDNWSPDPTEPLEEIDAVLAILRPADTKEGEG